MEIKFPITDINVVPNLLDVADKLPNAALRVSREDIDNISRLLRYAAHRIRILEVEHSMLGWRVEQQNSELEALRSDSIGPFAGYEP